MALELLAWTGKWFWPVDGMGTTSEMRYCLKWFSSSFVPGHAIQPRRGQLDSDRNNGKGALWPRHRWSQPSCCLSWNKYYILYLTRKKTKSKASLWDIHHMIESPNHHYDLHQHHHHQQLAVIIIIITTTIAMHCRHYDTAIDCPSIRAE